ncbi:MAG TPA: SpoIIE family protein phosphatase [Candidatus Deferrimicrobium sp.]|nr:SpoIIE family protein phosphatase [Candidatus Deferrimicrobium sp.]
MPSSLDYNIYIMWQKAVFFLMTENEIPPYRKMGRTSSPSKGKKTRALSWVSTLMQVDLWVNLFAGFMLARGFIMGELLPFGVAFFAAIVTQRPKLAWPMGVAVLAGTATVSRGLPLLSVTLSLLMLGILLQALKRTESWLVLPAVIFTGVAVIKAGILTVGKPSAYVAASAALECVLIAVFAVVFVTFLKSFQRIRRLRDLTVEESLCIILFSTGLINGMEGIQVWQITLGGLVSKFAVLSAAFLAGTGPGAATGVFLGFIPSLSRGGYAGFAGALGISGLMAGLFKSLGKIGAAAGFFLAMLLSTYYVNGGAEVLATLIETVIAILLFLILPVSAIDTLRTGSMTNASSKKKAFDFASLRVKGLAEIFEEIANSYQHAAAVDSAATKPDIPGLMNILADRVCANCPVVKSCWEKEFYRTYKNLLEIFTYVELKGSVQSEDLPVELRRQCGRIKEMVLAINFIFDNQRVSLNWSKRYNENREVISAQLRGVSGMMSNLAEELTLKADNEHNESRARARRRRDFLDVGVATVAKTGNSVCGDGYASIPIGEDKHAIILSDGMGVGEKAAQESSAALSLLEQLLRTGFDSESAVKTLNSILVLKSPEETFATVDMVVFSLDSNKIDFIKIGSAPSYIKSGDRIEVITASSLPVGILNNIDVEAISRELLEGDTLVMITDGLLDVVKNAPVDWIEEYLKETSTSDAQILAEELVVRAKSLAQGVVPDDMVALVIKKGYWG